MFGFDVFVMGFDFWVSVCVVVNYCMLGSGVLVWVVFVVVICGGWWVGGV